MSFVPTNVDNRQRHFESEMYRFENEISSIAPPGSSVEAASPAPPRMGMPPPPPFAPPGFVPPSVRLRQRLEGGLPPPPPVGGFGGPPAGMPQGPNFRQVPPPTGPRPTLSAASSSSFSSSKPDPPTPEALVAMTQPKASSSLLRELKKREEKKKRYNVRYAAGVIWDDPSMAEWDPNDFRMFCGDLGNEVTDEVLIRMFSRYPSFQKAKVVRDRRTNKSKGYGFVSFKDPADFMKAVKDLDGKYVGNRPIKLRRSDWKKRDFKILDKRENKKNKILGVKD